LTGSSAVCSLVLQSLAPHDHLFKQQTSLLKHS